MLTAARARIDTRPLSSRAAADPPRLSVHRSPASAASTSSPATRPPSSSSSGGSSGYTAEETAEARTALSWHTADTLTTIGSSRRPSMHPERERRTAVADPPMKRIASSAAASDRLYGSGTVSSLSPSELSELSHLRSAAAAAARVESSALRAELSELRKEAAARKDVLVGSASVIPSGTVSSARSESALRSTVTPSSASVPRPASAAAASSIRDSVTLLRDRLRREDARREEIRATLRAVRKSQEVDIAFVLDCTGSMAAHIRACADNILRVVQKVIEKSPQAHVRLAFVGYRDHSDGPHRLVHLPFTSDVTRFREFVGALKAHGGDDAAEDVFGGLHLASQLDWKSTTRVMFLIGDAPAHGREFHDATISDKFPDGDPHKLQLDAILRSLMAGSAHNHHVDGVRLFFCEVTPHTRQMLRVFNHRACALGLPAISTQNLRDVANFVEVVESSVTASILAVEHLTATVLPGIREGEMEDAAGGGDSSASASSHAAGASRLSSAHRLLKSFTLSPTVPSWRLEKSFVATVFKLDIRSLSPAQMWGDEQLPLHKRRGTFKVAGQPFAQGSERLAYYALNLSFTSEDKVDRSRSPSTTSSSRSSSRGRSRSRTREEAPSRSRSRAVSPAAAASTSPPKSIVLKEYKYRGKGWNKLARYLGHMEVQSVAAKLAQEFATAGGCAPGELKFVKATVIGREEVDARTGAVSHTYWACEPMVEGSYVKYNNNVGWVCDGAADEAGSGRSELLQTFSHFTYDFSGGHLCVVDLQGVNLLLTDPAIHCTNLLRFGRTNLGLDGMARFFRTHKCGKLCRKMNLKPFRVPEKEIAAVGSSGTGIAPSSRRRESVSRAA